MTLKKTLDSINEKVLKNFLENPEARTSLAMAMIAPIKAKLDYASIGRKTMSVEPIGFFCEKCKFTHVDVAHVHSDEECLTASVHLS